MSGQSGWFGITPSSLKRNVSALRSRKRPSKSFSDGRCQPVSLSTIFFPLSAMVIDILPAAPIDSNASRPDEFRQGVALPPFAYNARLHYLTPFPDLKERMAQRTGSADLPLHNGRVPPWLGQRMASLGAIMCQAIVHHYGRDEFLRRLAHPFWFQSFGAVMGMDWHSSGITTSVIGALKRGLTPLQNELGIYVCGGRGKHSRQTPQELVKIGEKVGFDGAAL